MESTNHSTVARVLVDALGKIMPDMDFSRVLLLLTDAAAYMLKMGKGVASLLPNCIHLTCMAHAVHRVAETIRAKFPDVDRLVSSCKKVFAKAPRRRSYFKELHPDVELPPEPITTRWGTWIEAVVYHTTNFETVADVASKLSSDDAAAISVLQDVLKLPQLKTDLAFITAHFSVLLSTLDKLEKRDIKAEAQWEAVHSVHEAVQALPALQSKWKAVLARNTGLPKLVPVLKALHKNLPDLGITVDKS